MKSKFVRSAAFAAVLIVSLAACSGGPGGASQNEPAGAVKAAFDAAQSGGLTKMAEFSCAAQKDSIAGLFGEAGDLAGSGIDADDIADAMKIEFKDIQTTEKSRSGTNAEVHVTGTSTISFDQAKMREIMRAVLAAQGQPVDDATLDMAMNMIAGQLTQTTPIDEDFTVVQEGGKWLICEPIS